jgi:hypothetical protein
MQDYLIAQISLSTVQALKEETKTGFSCVEQHRYKTCLESTSDCQL